MNNDHHGVTSVGMGMARSAPPPPQVPHLQEVTERLSNHLDGFNTARTRLQKVCEHLLGPEPSNLSNGNQVAPQPVAISALGKLNQIDSHFGVELSALMALVDRLETL